MMCSLCGLNVASEKQEGLLSKICKYCKKKFKKDKEK